MARTAETAVCVGAVRIGVTGMQTTRTLVDVNAWRACGSRRVISLIAHGADALIGPNCILALGVSLALGRTKATFLDVTTVATRP